ncbi:MAG: hypothetical protein M3N59_02090, partial [bacterium]|nr:hypothetical protein [bacterium]
MSERGPAPEPNENQREVPEHIREQWEDVRNSSPELQKEIAGKAEEEAWELYAAAHEISREDALADVRGRLHRLSEQGIEITPEIEQRELEHAEQSVHH